MVSSTPDGPDLESSARLADRAGVERRRIAGRWLSRGQLDRMPAPHPTRRRAPVNVSIMAGTMNAGAVNEGEPRKREPGVRRPYAIDDCPGTTRPPHMSRPAKARAVAAGKARNDPAAQPAAAEFRQQVRLDGVSGGRVPCGRDGSPCAGIGKPGGRSAAARSLLRSKWVSANACAASSSAVDTAVAWKSYLRSVSLHSFLSLDSESCGWIII